MTSPSGESSRPVGSDIPEADRRRLVDRGPFGYAVTTLEGAIVRVNSTLLGWLGTERDEVCGARTLQSLLGVGDRIYFDTHVRPLLHMGGAVRDVAVELEMTDGGRFPVLLSAEVIDHADGERVVEVVLIDARSRRSYEMELLRERQNAQRDRERVQLMYDLVSGFAGATTAEEVRAVVTAASVSPFSDARCDLWMFSYDWRAVDRLTASGDSARQEHVDIDRRAFGEGFEELATGQLVHIRDVDARADADRYPVISERLRHARMRSAVLAPLLDEGRLIGLLSFAFSDVRELDEPERLAVSSLAVQTSQTLRRARLHEAQVRASTRLASLHGFGRSLSSAVTIADVIAAILRAGHEVFAADDVRVGRLRPDDRLEISGGRPGVSSAAVDRPLAAADIACEAVRHPTLVLAATRNELEGSHPDSVVLTDPAVEHVMATSLADGERVVGGWVLGFDRSAPIDEDDRTLLRLFAEEASHAIRRAIVHEREANAARRAVIRQNISEALNRAATADAVADALVVEGRSAFDADGLAVLVVGEGELMTIGQTGLAPDADPTRRIPTSAPGVRRLLDSAAPVFSEGLAAVARDLNDLSLGDWGSSAVFPLASGGKPIGLMIVLYGEEVTLDVQSRRALAGIAAEASVAISRAMRFDVEHEIAVTLQQSMLSEQLPEVDGWRIDSWYAPSNSYLMIGGDLYDVTLLPDGRMVVVVGDVVGHGVEAASSLGQLRSAARALALDRDRPSELLDGLDAFARSSRGTRGASLCCVMIEPDGRGRYACAGHPYPILVEGSQAVLLREGRSELLGFGQGPRHDAEFSVRSGGSLVLYTDGVVERRAEAIDDGLERLRRLIETVDFRAEERPARTIGETMLAGGDHRDDAVVVSVSRSA